MTKLSKEAMREYMRKRREAVKVEAPKEPVVVEWDEKKFPVRGAWEIAVARAERARKYAEDMPEHLRPGERIFQTVEWQYEHEGLPAMRKQTG